MKWYRSYVKDFETTLSIADATGTPFIYDPAHCEPYYIEDDSNYWKLFEHATESFIIAEWDIAVSRDDRRRFERYCEQQPDIVHVAPYELYESAREAYTSSCFVHRTTANAWVQEGDPFCFYFGFGLTYLPLRMVKDYLAATKAGTTVLTDKDHPYTLIDGFVKDCTFSWWHATARNMEPVPIHWDVRPVHLHYSVRSTLD